MQILRKIAFIVLATSFFGILLNYFEIIDFSSQESKWAYIGFIVFLLIFLLGEGGGKSGPGSSHPKTGESVTGLTDR